MKCNANANVVCATFKAMKTVKVFCKLKSLHDKKKSEMRSQGQAGMLCHPQSGASGVQNGTTGSAEWHLRVWYSGSFLGSHSMSTLPSRAGPSCNLSQCNTLLVSFIILTIIYTYSLGLFFVYSSSSSPPH